MAACEHPECVDDATATISYSSERTPALCLRHTIALLKNRMVLSALCVECRRNPTLIKHNERQLCLSCAEGELARQDAARAMLKIDVCPRCGISIRNSEAHSDCSHCGECHAPEQASCPVCWICEKIHAPACDARPCSPCYDITKEEKPSAFKKVKPVQPSSTLVLCDKCDEWVNTNSAAQHMCEDNSLKIKVMQFPACPVCFNSTNDSKKSVCDSCVEKGLVCATCSVPKQADGDCKMCERKKSTETKRRLDFDAACDRHFERAAKKLTVNDFLPLLNAYAKRYPQNAGAGIPNEDELNRVRCIVERCDQPMTDETHFCEKHLSTAKGGV